MLNTKLVIWGLPLVALAGMAAPAFAAPAEDGAEAASDSNATGGGGEILVTGDCQDFRVRPGG